MHGARPRFSGHRRNHRLVRVPAFGRRRVDRARRYRTWSPGTRHRAAHVCARCRRTPNGGFRLCCRGVCSSHSGRGCCSGRHGTRLGCGRPRRQWREGVAPSAQAARRQGWVRPMLLSAATPYACPTATTAAAVARPEWRQHCEPRNAAQHLAGTTPRQRRRPWRWRRQAGRVPPAALLSPSRCPHCCCVCSCTRGTGATTSTGGRAKGSDSATGRCTKRGNVTTVNRGGASATRTSWER